MREAVCCIFLVALVSFPGCPRPGLRPDLVKIRAELEKKIHPYDPTCEPCEKCRHFALHLDLVNGELVLSERRAENRPGGFPFQSRTGGAVSIVYRDEHGTEIGRYSKTNLLPHSMCGPFPEEHEWNIPGRAETTEILLPYDSGIVILEITRKGLKTEKFSVGEKIAGADFIGPRRS